MSASLPEEASLEAEASARPTWLRQTFSALHYRDFRLLAISADPPAPLAKLKHDLALPFPLISDPERALVNRCELAHCVASWFCVTCVIVPQGIGVRQEFYLYAVCWVYG